jgi:mRNA-degrading endonuclease RelE of RelBE toxin-antitoxin system
MVQYDVVCRHDAKKVLTNLPYDDRNRLTDAINSVAEHRQPTDHNKCHVLNNNHNETLYKIRVGDYRVIARLEKPELRVLKVAQRQGAYSDIDSLYATL